MFTDLCLHKRIYCDDFVTCQQVLQEKIFFMRKITEMVNKEQHSIQNCKLAHAIILYVSNCERFTVC